MTGAGSRPIVIAGAGIAGLTCALAFAQRGLAVRVFERATRLEEAGAGIQLSPNATRVLRSLGVLPSLEPFAVRPEAVRLHDANTLVELARIPLGDFAEARWGAPYLVIHRADLQRALLGIVEEHPSVELVLGAEVRAVSFDKGRVTIQTGTAVQAEPPHRGPLHEHRLDQGALLIGADGVRSSVRQAAGKAESRFAGFVAWRATMAFEGSSAVIANGSVNAILHASAHLILYPLRGRDTLNLVAILHSGSTPDAASLAQATTGWHPKLRRLLDRASWSPWPIRTTDPRGDWTDARGLALVGDAAHAMTPFAAQGAAMAIEDAAVLAGQVAGSPDDLAAALDRYQALRRPRVLRVARRGLLNRLAWHASGPIALARNGILRLRGPERLAADLDWLYGHRLEKEKEGTGHGR